MDPSQLATESAFAEFLWNMLVMLFLGMAGGGAIALVLVVAARVLALRDEAGEWPYD